MSCYFIIYAKNKNVVVNKNVNEALDNFYKNRFELFSLCTTPARELDENVGHFKFDEYTPLSIDLLKDIVDFYTDKIEFCKEAIENEEKQLKILWELLPKIENVEIFDKIREEISNIQEYSCIEEEKNDIEFYTYRISELRYIMTLMEDNKTDWDFYYYFG